MARDVNQKHMYAVMKEQFRTHIAGLPGWAEPQHFFLILAILFGPLFVFITPPFGVPDETSHFYRSYQLSELHVKPHFRSPEDKWPGQEFPESILELYRQSGIELVNFHPERKLDLKTVQQLMRIPLDPEKKHYFYSPHAGYPPVSHAPQAMAIFIGGKLQFPPMALLYFGRLANLAVWITLMYFAIRLTPTGKWLMAALSLTPMSMFLAGSVSGDVLTNALSFFMIAWLLRLMFNGNRILDGKGFFPLLIVALLFAFCKQAYFAITLLFLLVPADRVGGTKRLILYFLVLLLSQIALIVAWQKCCGFYGFLRGVASPPEQIAFMKENLFAFPAAMARTLLTQADLYISFIGLLGWLDTRLPNIVIVACGLMLTVVAVTDHEPDAAHPSMRDRLMFLAICGASAGMIFLNQYITWTRPGAGTVEGVQGRYFIPFAPLFFLVFRSRRIRMPVAAIRIFVFVVVCMSLSMALIALVRRYYIA